MKRLSTTITRILGAIVILLAFAANATAQEAKTLLWEISGNGLEKPSYLYGTIHLMCKEDFAINENLQSAFKAAEQVALEVDLADPAEMQAFQTGMMKMSGVDYKGIMSEKDYNRLDELIKAQYGVGMAAMKIMKPFGMMSVLYTEIMGCGQPESYELSFVQMAKEQEKEMFGLESAASQVAIFDNIPEEEQIGWLTDMMNNTADNKADWDKMVNNYKAQDLEALYASMAEAPEYAKYEDELLDKRNRAWIPKIGELAKEKSTFIAVGAMHLAGDSGVIKLLREAGYTVSPMDN
jgi:uncharacterized protein YbaP (TraB family)